VLECYYYSARCERDGNTVEKIRKQKSYRRSYGPVVLWLDDLTEIVAVLMERSKKVQISTEDYRFGTVDELKEHVGSQTQFALEIDCHEPYVLIDFDRNSATLYVSAGDQAAHLFNEIDGIIARRQRRFRLLYSWPLLMMASAGTIVADYFLFFGPPEVEPYVRFILPFLAICIIGPLLIRWNRVSVIKLQRRSDAPSFLERNKDKVLMLIIGALITLAVGAVKEKFYPSAPATTQSKPA
jgi:hypothetical protein